MQPQPFYPPPPGPPPAHLMAAPPSSSIGFQPPPPSSANPSNLQASPPSVAPRELAFSSPPPPLPIRLTYPSVTVELTQRLVAASPARTHDTHTHTRPRLRSSSHHSGSFVSNQNESTSAAKKASITDMLSKKTLTAEEIEQLKMMVRAATPQIAAEPTVLPAADTLLRSSYQS